MTQDIQIYSDTFKNKYIATCVRIFSSIDFPIPLQVTAMKTEQMTAGSVGNAFTASPQLPPTMNQPSPAISVAQLPNYLLDQQQQLYLEANKSNDLSSFIPNAAVSNENRGNSIHCSKRPKHFQQEHSENLQYL